MAAVTMEGRGLDSISLTEVLLGTAPGAEPSGPVEPPPPAPPGRHRHAVPRSRRANSSRPKVMAVTIVDQAASSASNFGVAFLIAHYSHANTLGVFAIIQATYVLTQGLVRGLTSDCLLTRHDDDHTMEHYERSGYLSAILCATFIAIIVLAISGLFTTQFREVFVIFALSFPLMACQDYARYIGISRYNPIYAVWLDLAWLFLFIAVFVVLRNSHHTSLAWIYAAWSFTGAAVGIYSLWNHLSLRHPIQMVKFWFKSEAHVGVRFAGQWLLASSWTYVAIYLLTLIITLAAIGQFKLAQLAFGPVTVMTQGVAVSMVALASRYFAVDVRRALRFVALGILASAAVMVVWTFLLYFAPVHAMTKALGPTWPEARALVPLSGATVMLAAASQVIVAGIHSLRAAKQNLRLAIAMVPILFSFSMVSALLWGVKGSIAGIGVGFLIYDVAGWIVLSRVSHRMDAEKQAESPEDLIEELSISSPAGGGMAEPAVGSIGAG